MKNNFLTFIIVIFMAAQLDVQAQTLSLTSFCTGLTSPVDIKNAGDSRLFVIEQAGKIRIIDSLGVLNPTPFLNITSLCQSAGNEQGLLGMAFHPDYKNNGYFFVDYTDNSSSTGYTIIARIKVSANPDVADPTSQVTLLKIKQPYTNHNGGNLQFGPDGYLYIDMGDGGSGGDPGNRAQNLDTLLGKVLRIDVNNPNIPYYFSPPTNPFFGVTAGRDEIWAYGVRNPWRASFDRITGDFWIADVGQNIWEEVDFQPAGIAGGRNYGWNCYEGLVAYSACTPPGVIYPIAVYQHTGGNCSITGGYIYRGAKYAGLWGYYLYEDFCSGVMRSIKDNGAGGWTINNSVGTFLTNSYTTFGEDRYGEMYIASRGSGANGTIYRIAETSDCHPVAFITMKDSLHGCDSLNLKALFNFGLTYQWTKDGSVISGATNSSLMVSVNGWYSVTVSNLTPCSSTSDSVYVTITPTPVVSFATLDTLYCFNAPPVTLIGSPAGGAFTGTGMLANTFTPSSAGAGTFSVTYNYTDLAGCSSSASSSVRVDHTIAYFTANDSIHGCDSTLLQATTGTGFVYQWIKNGIAIPAGINSSLMVTTNGYYSLTVHNADMCPDTTDSVYVWITPNPVVSFSMFDTVFCATDPPYLLGATPSGGVFLGAGVTGNVFYPTNTGGGISYVKYVYTDPAGCKDADSVKVLVDQIIYSLAGLDTVYCVNHPPTALSGSPAGTFSGLGVNLNTFYPDSAGIGTDTITYFFVDGMGCGYPIKIAFTVDPCTGISDFIAESSVSITPNPTSGKVNIEIEMPNSEIVRVDLINMLGEKIVSQKISLSTGNNSIPLTLEKINPGIYFVFIELKNGIVVRKLVLQK